MPIDLKRRRILGCQDLHGGIRLDQAGQVGQLPINLGDNGGVGQSRADGPGDIDGTATRLDWLLAAIGKGDLNAAHSEISA